jgi:hypothetical protein
VPEPLAFEVASIKPAVVSEGVLGAMSRLWGGHTYSVRWVLEGSPNPDGLPTSVFTALEEQTGLRLEAATDTSQTLVVDHVERPTED